MIQITIEDYGVIQAKEGEQLYRVLSEAGLLEAPCGGQGICGKCGVTVDGEWTLSCACRPASDIRVVLPGQAAVSGIVADGFTKEFTRDGAKEGELGIVADIGTTTVVAALVDLHTGEERAALSCLNSQKSFGQDVISRIHFAAEHEGAPGILQQRILGDLRALFGGLLEKDGADAESVKKIIVAGNTTMIHLLAREDTAPLGRSPYTPAFTGPMVLSASALGLPAAEGTEAYCIPAVSAFVGGDITSGVLTCDLAGAAGNVLFIDIGTNGEIVLKKGDQLFCCSCAAGPALEGMNIDCGMRAAAGAVENVRIGEKGVECKTIGGGPATGICGSGILSAVTELLRAGLMNRSGRLKAHPLIAESEDGRRSLVLDGGGNVYLSQKDVRQVQLAKGAILSGIRALLSAAELRDEELDRVLVAGQFGAHLKPESLTGSGILPGNWTSKIEYVGNTSKSGAYICLLSGEEREKAGRLAEQMEYIELASLKGYEDLFVSCLNF